MPTIIADGRNLGRLYVVALVMLGIAIAVISAGFNSPKWVKVEFGVKKDNVTKLTMGPNRYCEEKANTGAFECKT